MSPKTFHETLHGSVQDGVSYIFVLETRKVEYFNCQDSKGFAEFVQANADQTLFYGICPATKMLPRGKRASRETVSALPALAIDIDIQNAEGAHKETKLPASQEEALKWVHQLDLPKPSLVVSSGYGLHVYWLLSKPIALTDEDSRTQAEALLRKLNSYVQQEAGHNGWSLDNVSDLPRLLRVPGSYNHKGEHPVPVQVIEDSSTYYALEQLEGSIPSLESMPSIEAASSFAFDDCKPREYDKKADFRLVYEGCHFVRDCASNQESVNEPLWYALITIVARCEDGRRLSHEVSKRHPEYDPSKTDNKVNHALSDVTGPLLCKTIAEKLNYSGCQTCPLYLGRKLKSPIALGLLEEKGLPALLSRWVYNLQTDEYVQVAA